MSEESRSKGVYDFHDDTDSEIPQEQDNYSQKDLFAEEDVAEGREGKKYKQSKIQKNVIRAVAVREKIVVCIDSSQDAAVGYASSSSNQNQHITEAFTVRNEALRVFFINKLAIAKDTEFAILSVMSGKVHTVSRFTSDVNHLVTSLSSIEVKAVEECISEYDVTPIFSSVLSLIDVQEDSSSKNAPVEFLLRVIFIFNNSHSVPRCNDGDKFYLKFMESPHCILDVLFLHEAQSDFNKVKEIYEQLGKVVSPHSFLFESSRDVSRVFNVFAKLLSHPYQRTSQELWEF